jgi:hypothetical protein
MRLVMQTWFETVVSGNALRYRLQCPPELALQEGELEPSHERNTNLSARVSRELSDRVELLSGVLGISKRMFVEAAVIEACRSAEVMLRELGVDVAMESHEREGWLGIGEGD